jgi:hypothetical protein
MKLNLQSLSRITPLLSRLHVNHMANPSRTLSNQCSMMAGQANNQDHLIAIGIGIQTNVVSSFIIGCSWPSHSSTALSSRLIRAGREIDGEDLLKPV